MSFGAGVIVQRDRRKPVANPMNPDRQTVPGWGEVDEDGLDTIDLPGVYLGNSSTNAVPDAMRQASTEYLSLYTTDSTVDVQMGDRIRYGDRHFYVNAIPPLRIPHPWSGWDPGSEFPLATSAG